MMESDALTCAVKLVRRGAPSAAEWEAFLAWAQAQVRYALALRSVRSLSQQDVEDLASDYAARLFTPAFRPHWATLSDKDIARLVLDDFHGCHVEDRYHPGWIDERIAERLRSPHEQPPVSAAERTEPDAVCRWQRRQMDAWAPASWTEEPTDDALRHEAAWRTLTECLDKYCEAEWPAAWHSRYSRLVAHVLLWYKKRRNEAHEMNDVARAEARRLLLTAEQLVTVLRLPSAAAASRMSDEAEKLHRPQPAATRTAVFLLDVQQLRLALADVLATRDAGISRDEHERLKALHRSHRLKAPF